MDSKRPAKWETDDVYSNFDNQLDTKVAEKLATSGTYAQHSAWGFCGYVWCRDGKWYEEVWQYNNPVEVIEGDSVHHQVISEANDKYGSQ